MAQPEGGAPDPLDEWLASIDPAQFEADEFVFGGKLAEGLDAAVSESREEQGTHLIHAKQDERRKEAARKTDWRDDLSALSFDERVTATLDCLERRQSFLNTLRGLLIFCDTERTYDEVDEFARSFPEFTANRTSSHRYVFFLRRTGAMEEVEYDSDGVAITDEMRDELREAGAPEEEIEDLAVEWHVRTTDVGRRAVELTDPALRLSALLAVKESRLPTYCRVLAFCEEEPRSLEAISALLRDDPGLEVDERTGIQGMQPSAYISKLDQAGVLVWNDGWSTTEEGSRVLHDILAQQAADQAGAGTTDETIEIEEKNVEGGNQWH